MWSFAFRALLQAGAEAGYRCFAADHLGCGLSTRSATAPMRFTDHSRRWQSWVEAVIAEPFHLVVHDWGGPIALDAVTRRPEQLRSLTILNTAAWLPTYIPQRIALCRAGALGKLITWRLNGFARPATWMTTTKPLDATSKRAYLYPFAENKNRRAVWEFVHDIPMEKAHPSRQALAELDARLSALQGVPMQIHWGMQDWCFHEKSLMGWEQRFPEAPVTRHPQAGHYVWEDAQGPLTAALIRHWQTAA